MPTGAIEVPTYACGVDIFTLGGTGILRLVCETILRLIHNAAMTKSQGSEGGDRTPQDDNPQQIRNPVKLNPKLVEMSSPHPDPLRTSVLGS